MGVMAVGTAVLLLCVYDTFGYDLTCIRIQGGLQLVTRLLRCPADGYVPFFTNAIRFADSSIAGEFDYLRQMSGDAASGERVVIHNRKRQVVCLTDLRLVVGGLVGNDFLGGAVEQLVAQVQIWRIVAIGLSQEVEPEPSRRIHAGVRVRRPSGIVLRGTKESGMKPPLDVG